MKTPCRLHETEEIISEMDLFHVADFKLNVVKNPDKDVRVFAIVTFGDCFKINNITVVKI